MTDLTPQAHHGHTEGHGCGCQGNCRNCPRRQGEPAQEGGPVAPKGPGENETPARA
jgi:hypothetical protein